ncbi:pyrimidine 5'-nucleotidase YjjG [Clostridium homopropionicum DSM 5847]|uniref:Pyrimidine 5'-nucleotidase YjjG n=1 Tax=Clostridium homopropionicum DSM 5847 TaxID=1121318 RepID=A0A0L6Z5V0_9CLOT|nr:YjjG family noncanonical pyrimidine nucleotidase [Clostridium homopropionicum]KOA18336.1 pyrimidine 5'-nucleotidase YjjG [Clostridium homopropionicum DSM 5847]SFF68975.1 putative hydrolase of the HAD superfamily [Clostridium homopropionicum]
MKYKLIIFDADETLLDFSKAEEYAFKNTMEYFNKEYETEYHFNTYKEINKNIWGEFEKELITAEELKEERFRRLFNKLNMNLDTKEVNGKYIDNLCQGCFILDGALELLNDLKGKFKLVLITNGLTTVQDARIRRSQIGEFFDSVVISEEVGVAKPNPGIFEFAFKKAGHNNKETALIVGDSLTSDIKGGANFGIDTCWFNPKHLENTTEIKPVYEIHSLNQLKDILFYEN